MDWLWMVKSSSYFMYRSWERSLNSWTAVSRAIMFVNCKCYFRNNKVCSWQRMMEELLEQMHTQLSSIENKINNVNLRVTAIEADRQDEPETPHLSALSTGENIETRGTSLPNSGRAISTPQGGACDSSSLSPSNTWSVPSHYLNQWWNIVNWTYRNKLWWNFNRNSYIFIQENAFETGVWEMAAILSRPQFVNWIYWKPYDDGILPKGPYPPCLRMADRALLAGYPRWVYVFCKLCDVAYTHIPFWPYKFTDTKIISCWWSFWLASM